ncbi:hypothetical protein MOQ_010047 [Trypanosoma cruzi marinkellei]|uniref:Uncharacterized protein n=1 Tax=Trypanosoma cruzi marinkellei TaxID=85056 RepID=K2MGL3_TRYCR|nr:hypothetical protein MOQ_010047 [Trypanosoma cruzi marinkellei]
MVKVPALKYTPPPSHTHTNTTRLIEIDSTHLFLDFSLLLCLTTVPATFGSFGCSFVVTRLGGEGRAGRRRALFFFSFFFWARIHLLQLCCPPFIYIYIISCMTLTNTRLFLSLDPPFIVCNVNLRRQCYSHVNVGTATHAVSLSCYYLRVTYVHCRAFFYPPYLSHSLSLFLLLYSALTEVLFVVIIIPQIPVKYAAHACRRQVPDSLQGLQQGCEGHAHEELQRCSEVEAGE